MTPTTFAAPNAIRLGKTERSVYIRILVPQYLSQTGKFSLPDSPAGFSPAARSLCAPVSSVVGYRWLRSDFGGQSHHFPHTRTHRGAKGGGR